MLISIYLKFIRQFTFTLSDETTNSLFLPGPQRNCVRLLLTCQSTALVAESIVGFFRYSNFFFGNFISHSSVAVYPIIYSTLIFQLNNS